MGSEGIASRIPFLTLCLTSDGMGSEGIAREEIPMLSSTTNALSGTRGPVLGRKALGTKVFASKIFAK